MRLIGILLSCSPSSRAVPAAIGELACGGPVMSIHSVGYPHCLENDQSSFQTCDIGRPRRCRRLVIDRCPLVLENIVFLPASGPGQNPASCIQAPARVDCSPHRLTITPIGVFLPHFPSLVLLGPSSSVFRAPYYHDRRPRHFASSQR